MKRLLTLFAVIGSLSLGACAFTPKTFDPKLASIPNPTQGPAVKIVSVEDARVFGPFVSGKCDTPSVEGDYHDKALTSRVIARLGCNYERANILLPEGKTVATLIGDVVMNAFKESGYRVLPSSAQEPAMELNVKILESWVSWKLEGMGARRTALNTISISTNKTSDDVKVADHFSDNFHDAFVLPGIHHVVEPYVNSIDILKQKLKEQIKNHSFTADNQTASVQ